MADLERAVKAAARKAFDRIGTLAKNVTFSSNSKGDFNFDTMTQGASTSTQVQLKAVVTEKKRKSNSDSDSISVISKTLILLEEDCPNLNSYDTVTIGTEVWNVVHPVISNGYTLTVDINREV
jgi:hypothetical protein